MKEVGDVTLSEWDQSCKTVRLSMEPCSLRSKRFQSSYSAKVGAEAIENGRGGGREKRKPSLPSPSPVIAIFFFALVLACVAGAWK